METRDAQSRTRFSIRTLLLVLAAVASLFPLVWATEPLVFSFWLTAACVVWGATGLSMRKDGSRRLYAVCFSFLPLAVGYAALVNVAVCDGWPEVEVRLSLPPGASEGTTLHYIALHHGSSLRDALAMGTNCSDCIEVKDYSKPLKIRTGYSYRRNAFGYTWGHTCEFDVLLFLAKQPDGRTWHGTVELPVRYDPTPLTIHWHNSGT